LVAIEELTRWPPRELEKKNSFRSADKPARAAVGSIGTEYGRDIDSRVYYVPFVRSHRKTAITIYYDTEEALRAGGVPVDRVRPVPFPADSEFAPPPPGQKGH